MSKQNSLKIQSCILRVNVDCKGCAQKVTKLLQKINGVSSVSIDAAQGKVTVTGGVDPAILIKKLKRSGKHAELWDGMNMYNQNYPTNNHFQNLQVDNNSKGGKNSKSQNQKGQKGGGGGDELAHFQNMEGAHNLKVPQKQNKSVKFNLPDEEFDGSGHGHDESDDYDEEEEEGYGHGHPMDNNKTMPMMGNGAGPRGPAAKMNGPVMNNHKGNGGGGGNYGSGIKKKSAKSDGDVLGRFLGFGKKNKKGEGAADTYIGIEEEEKGNGRLGGYGNNSKGKHDFDFHDKMPSHHGKNGVKGKGSNGNGNMGQMGPVGNNNPMDNIPAMNGGGGYEYHQGMQMQPDPYNIDQQQYMAMMMNQQQQQQQQQQANMNSMYPPPAMMYGGQHPSMNYMPTPPPPMPSHPMADPITHSLSDENPEACSIM